MAGCVRTGASLLALLSVLLGGASACGSEAPGLALRLRFGLGVGPPPEGEAPPDIAGYRVCVAGPGITGQLCRDFARQTHPEGADLRVPAGEDRTVDFYGYDAAGSPRWCARAVGVEVVRDQTTPVRLFATRCGALTPIRCVDGAAQPPCRQLSVPRAFHTATKLPDGRVLLSGGFRFVEAQSSCDPSCQWDPSSGGFTDGAGSACVPQCRLLVADATADLYDPSVGRVVQTFDLLVPRALHSASLLPDGTVLLVGGVERARLRSDGDPLFVPESFSGGAMAERLAERLDPFLGTSTPVAAAGPRAMHGAASLPEGVVWIAGGTTVRDGNTVGIGGTTWRGDPPAYASFAGETLEAGSAPLLFPRFAPRTVAMGTRLVTIGGAAAPDAQQAGVIAEVYEPETQQVMPLPDPGDPSLDAWGYLPVWHTATPVDGQRILVSGGWLARERTNGPRAAPAFSPRPWTLVLDLGAGSLAPTEPPALLEPRALHAAAGPLEDGEVLLTGGVGGTGPPFEPLSSLERVAVEWSQGRIVEDGEGTVLSLRTPRIGPTATLLDDGRVLVAGGLVDLPVGRTLPEAGCIDADPAAAEEALVSCTAEIYDPTFPRLDPPPTAGLAP
ncbi:MAG: hypothetical protein D6729_12560 [Deltaproteobacteria bacterium]|nr:MAG: hypothetical protein D6729_12560 [Deltaproteobacteria bacterium]